ncbi:unnamed protein product [Gongylonema pulchrum]|uniref:Uncharacterized protein n=1 Tax=Gongylonema pulchrum TaxID=637853 RepID=A0A183E363_9BILA|nr:unnamed protein product [Gongylonema pulchrum]
MPFSSGRPLLQLDFTADLTFFSLFQIALEEAVHAAFESIQQLKQSIAERKEAILQKKATLDAINAKIVKEQRTSDELTVTDFSLLKFFS